MRRCVQNVMAFLPHWFFPTMIWIPARLRRNLRLANFNGQNRTSLCRTGRPDRWHGRDSRGDSTAAAEVFREADQVLGRELSKLAWSGPIEELTKTSNCQP